MDGSIWRGDAVLAGEPSETVAVCGGGEGSPELVESYEEKDECGGTEAGASRAVWEVAGAGGGE